MTLIKFRRSLNTGDSNDAVLKLDQSNTFIWAYHPTSDALIEHSSSACGSFSAVLSSTNEASRVTTLTNGVNDRLVIHGVMMIAAWIFLVPLGIIVAKFYKRWGHKWYQLHAGMQSLACFMTIVSFIIVLMAKNPNHSFFSKNAVTVVHAVIGVVITSLGALFQPAIGKIADSMWRPDRVGTPMWPDRIHWYIGRSLTLMAFINVILGIILIDESVDVWFGVSAVILMSVVGLWIWSWKIYVPEKDHQPVTDVSPPLSEFKTGIR